MTHHIPSVFDDKFSTNPREAKLRAAKATMQEFDAWAEAATNGATYGCFQK